jgi:hypothetical protein
MSSEALTRATERISTECSTEYTPVVGSNCSATIAKDLKTLSIDNLRELIPKI